MRRVEALHKTGAEGNRELEGLAAIAEVRFAVTRELAHLHQGLDVRADGVDSLLGRDETDCGKQAGRGRNEHGSDLELVCERARVQRPRAAERDEGEVAWIEALLHGDDAKRPHHLRVHDLDHSSRIEAGECTACGVRVEPDAAWKLRGKSV